MVFTSLQSRNLVRKCFIWALGNVNIKSNATHQKDPVDESLQPLVALGATYDSDERDPPPKCHSGTRKDILDKILSWAVVREESGKIMWLHGPAGAGKSAIAQTICEICASDGSNCKLAASFFFSGNRPTEIARNFFPTITFQLATFLPGFRPCLAKEIQRNGFAVASSMATQIKDLVAVPFRDYIEETGSEQPCIIAIDGVDKCGTNGEQDRIISNVINLVRVYHLPINILIVSRSEAHIEDIFLHDQIPNCDIESLSDYSSPEDVRLFLQEGFTRIRNSTRHADIMRHVKGSWPSPSIIEQLVLEDAGNFKYAATVLESIDREGHSPIERLNQMMNPSQDPHSPTAIFDAFYTQILSKCSDQWSLLKEILAFHLVYPADNAISLEAINDILKLPQGTTQMTLRCLRSLVKISGRKFAGPHTYCDFYHPSLSDFLLDPVRAGSYFIDRESFLTRVHPLETRGSISSNEDLCPDLVRESRKSACALHVHVVPLENNEQI